MGLFLLALTIVGAASLRTFIPALQPRSPAERLDREPPPLPEPPKAEEEVFEIPIGGLPGLPAKLSPCSPGTRPVRVSKLFPDGTIRGAIACMPDPKRAQGESSLRAPDLFGPIDLSELKGAL